MNKFVLRNIVVYILLIMVGIFLVFGGQSLSKEYPYVVPIIGILLIAMGTFRMIIYVKLVKDDEIKK